MTNSLEKEIAVTYISIKVKKNYVFFWKWKIYQESFVYTCNLLLK